MKKFLLPVLFSFGFALWLTACGGAASESSTAPAEETAPAAPVDEDMEASQPEAEAVVEELETAAEPEVAVEVTTEEPTAAPAVEEAVEPETEPTPAEEAVAEESAAEAEMAEEPAEETVVEEEVVEEVPAETDVEAVVEVDWLTNEGQTEDGFAFLGNPDAPITVVDYSDFL